MNLESELPRLVPKAVQWAKEKEQVAKEVGRPLSGDLIGLATRIGVQQPDSVRIVVVDSLPQPDDPELQEVAAQIGLLGPDMVGLTLGHAVFLVEGHGDARLISHEFRHVHQYEQYGSIDEFLPVYLDQVVSMGYRDAPLEIDARNHEVRLGGKALDSRAGGTQ